jgi:hypothetical protein
MDVAVVVGDFYSDRKECHAREEQRARHHVLQHCLGKSMSEL